MSKKYLVEWSAPNYRNSGRMTVTASNKPEAVEICKRKLGKKVKQLNLHHFYAIG